MDLQRNSSHLYPQRCPIPEELAVQEGRATVNMTTEGAGWGVVREGVVVSAERWAWGL